MSSTETLTGENVPASDLPSSDQENAPASDLPSSDQENAPASDLPSSDKPSPVQENAPAPDLPSSDKPSPVQESGPAPDVPSSSKATGSLDDQIAGFVADTLNSTLTPGSTGGLVPGNPSAQTMSSIIESTSNYCTKLEDVCAESSDLLAEMKQHAKPTQVATVAAVAVGAVSRFALYSIFYDLIYHGGGGFSYETMLFLVFLVVVCHGLWDLLQVDVRTSKQCHDNSVNFTTLRCRIVEFRLNRLPHMGQPGCMTMKAASDTLSTFVGAVAKLKRDSYDPELRATWSGPVFKAGKDGIVFSASK